MIATIEIISIYIYILFHIYKSSKKHKWLKLECINSCCSIKKMILSWKVIEWMVKMIVSIEYKVLYEYVLYEIQDVLIDNEDLEWNQQSK
jgi:hypothetical protein